jgi:hypothetical protein
MKIYRNASIKLVLLVLLSVSIIHAGDYKFRYNMKKGTTYKYKYTTVHKMTSDREGKKKNDGSKIILIFTITIDEISSKGNFICTAKIDSFSWDIDNEDSKASKEVWKNFAGKRVKLTISPDGKTLDSVPIDNLSIPQPGPKAGIKPDYSPANMLRLPKWILPEPEIKMNVPFRKSSIDTSRQAELNSKQIKKTITEHNLCGNKKIGRYNCKKIITNITEISDYKGYFKEVSMNLTGNSKRKIVTYFAPAEGILVQSSEEETSSEDETTIDKGQKSGAKNNHTGNSTFLLLH